MAARTLELVDLPSVSGDEAAVLAWIRRRMQEPEDYELLDDEDSVLFYAPTKRRPGAPLVVLAGHVDTVPVAGNVPGSRQVARPDEEMGDVEEVVGRGAADMKGALAVMLEVALALAEGHIVSDLDVGFLFFGREELPFADSALLPFFARCTVARTIDYVIVMEPTENTIEVGCMGNLNARVTVGGTAAHSARPWLGENAIHRALQVLGPVAELPVRELQIEGLRYREVMSVTTIQGGVATNVIPDRVEADINFRYAPTCAPDEAEARLRRLIEAPGVEVRVVGNAPPGPVTVGNPLFERLWKTDRTLVVGPKQAWTSVAEFATIGVDAVNFGPGDPQYAHRDDERVLVNALAFSYGLLRMFLSPEPLSDAEGGTE